MTNKTEFVDLADDAFDVHKNNRGLNDEDSEKERVNDTFDDMEDDYNEEYVKEKEASPIFLKNKELFKRSINISKKRRGRMKRVPLGEIAANILRLKHRKKL